MFEEGAEEKSRSSTLTDYVGGVLFY